MPKKYLVELTVDERKKLSELLSKGKAAARKIQHAQVLLKADCAPSAPAWKDRLIAETFLLSVRTVERVRERFVEHGLEDALTRRQRNRSRRRRLDGEGEARLIVLACSKAPDGRKRWTLQLLADKLVELEVVDQIVPETVRQTLKKTKPSPG